MSIFILQQAQTANVNGQPASLDGYLLVGQVVEIAETAGGTATVTLEGSFDGANWLAVGYQRLDAQATLTRAATGFAVTANLRATLGVLDAYPQLRARISATAAATITAKLYAQEQA